MAIAPGHTTTEYTLTKFLMGVGTVLTVAGPVLAVIPQTNQTISIVTVVVGALTALLSQFGYVRSRTAIKIAGESETPASDAP